MKESANQSHRASIILECKKHLFSGYVENWFSKDSENFFGTEYETGILAGKYFITSSQMEEGRERKFEVVEICDGFLKTISGFHQFSTLAAAKVWLKGHVYY